MLPHKNDLAKLTASFNSLLGLFLIIFIKIYQKAISPILGRRCRFYPTCSQYAIIAIKRYGPVKGVILAIKRIVKCHPGHPGGFDPVP